LPRSSARIREIDADDLRGFSASLGNALSIAGVFTGPILNRENIGKTSEELILKWNENNLEDQVTTE
jgi:hypothetical protein